MHRSLQFMGKRKFIFKTVPGNPLSLSSLPIRRTPTEYRIKIMCPIKFTVVGRLDIK